jgi:hypothetical protein
VKHTHYNKKKRKVKDKKSLQCGLWDRFPLGLTLFLIHL